MFLCIQMLCWSLRLDRAGQRCLGPRKYEMNIKSIIQKHIGKTLTYITNMKISISEPRAGLGWAGQRCLGPQTYEKQHEPKQTNNKKHEHNMNDI